MIFTLSASGCGSVELPPNTDGTGGTGPGTGSNTGTGSGGMASTSSGSTTSGNSTGSGPTNTPPMAELDPSAVAQAAVFVGSCMPDDGIGRNLNRFYTHRGGQLWWEQPITDRLACLKDKTNGCKAVEECFGLRVDLTGPCQTTCDGDVLTRCDGTLKFQIDCKKVGFSCSAQAGFCVQTPPPPICDGTTFQSKCDAGAPVNCGKYASEVRGPVCADYGLQCVGSDDGDASCQGTGPICDGDFFPDNAGTVRYDNGIACQGLKLRACVNYGEAVVDCGTVGKGFTCQSGTSAFCGLATECTPNEGSSTSGAKATCEGNKVVFCNAGRIEKVDCTTLGFTGCDPTLGLCIPNIFN